MSATPRTPVRSPSRRRAPATRRRDRRLAGAGGRMERSRGDLGGQPLAESSPSSLAEAVAASGHPVVRLPSGAGHDAAMLSSDRPGRDAVRPLRRRRQPQPGRVRDGRGRRGGDRRDNAVPRARRMSFDVLIRGATVVGAGEQTTTRRRRGRRADRRPRPGAIGSREPRRSTPPACISCPGSSTPTCT